MLRPIPLSLALLLITGCATTPEAPATTAPPETPADAAVAEAPPPVPPEAAWRAERPAPGEPSEIVTPTFERGKLKNGMTVLVSRRTELPMVSLNVAFRAGAAGDPAGKGGLADLTYSMLTEGAGKLDALALSDAFADLGVSPSVSVGHDGALVGVRVLSRNRDRALQLLADMVQRPTFGKEAFDRRKKQQLADLALAVGSPQYLAQEAFADQVFGAKHPYGHPRSGTPATVTGLTLQDVTRYWKAHAGPATTALVITGDVTLKDAVAWGEKHFGKWRARAKAPPVPPEPALAPREEVVLVPRPGLDQTIILVGRPAIRAGGPDEWALRLASTVYGGFFGSRLNMNLREEKGYTYGAFSSVEPRRGVGPLVAGSSVRADVTGPALSEVFQEMADLKTNPITEAELEAAREGVIRSIPGWFETIEGLAGTAANLFNQELPLDRYENLVKGLETATAEEVQAAAVKYFDPQTVQVILVGDPDMVRLQVPELGLGEIEVHPPGGMTPEPPVARLAP